MLFRSIDGIAIKFNGTNFQVGDKFYVYLVPREYLSSTYKVTFTTGSGSIQTLPDNASTSVLGDLNSPIRNDFSIISSSPKDGATKITDKLKLITVRFSNDINPLTVNDHNVRVNLTPAMGYDVHVDVPDLAGKFMFVKGNVLYILLQKGVDYE